MVIKKGFDYNSWSFEWLLEFILYRSCDVFKGCLEFGYSKMLELVVG